HALSHIGFAGATGAGLVGLAPLWGLIAFTLAAGIIMGALSERISNRDVAIGVVLALALGFGLLFLHYHTSFATQATALLFGNVLAVDHEMIATLALLGAVTLAALAFIMRPLVFSSLQPELAEAKGVPLRVVSVAFLALVALTVSVCAQIVGVLLVFTLMVGPPAAAQRITTGLWSGLFASAALAMGEAWLGLTIAFYTDWPVSFCIACLSALAYFVCIALPKRTRRSQLSRGLYPGNAQVLHFYAMRGHVLHRARMPRDRRIGFDLVFEREVLGLAMHRDEVRLLVEDRLDDVVGVLIRHLGVRDQDIPHDGVLVVRRLPGVSARFDGAPGIEVALLGVHLRGKIGVIDELQLHAGRGAKVSHRRCRQTADPEERIDLVVLECVHRLGNTEPLAFHVLVLVESGRLDHPEAHHLGGTAARTGGDALALEIGHLLDAHPFDRHHVHLVRIKHHQRADRNLGALELVLSFVGIERRIHHRERNFAAPGINQLEIVDRAAGDFRGRLDPRQ